MKRHPKHKGIYYNKLQDGSTSYYIRPTINGKRTWKKAGSTITAAKNLLAEVQQLKNNEWLGVKIPRRIKFEKLVDLYFVDYKKRREDLSGVPSVKSTLLHLINTFRGRWASSLSSFNIEQAALPRQESIYLRAVLRKGKKWGFLGSVPDFTIPRAAKKLDRVISTAELERILEQASPNHRDAILLCLSLGGCRLGELCKISRKNTDFRKRFVSIEDRKAGVPKRFYLTDTAMSILKRRFIANGGVAFTETAGKLSYRFFHERRQMKRVKAWRFHDLRHTITGILGDRRVDIETIREVLGHTSIVTTERYMHSSEAKERAALALVENFIIEKYGLKTSIR